MNKLMKNSIVYALGTLAILAFGVTMTPAYVSAEGGINTTYDTSNPRPSVNSISPRSGNAGTGARTITITGRGFTPSSIAHVDGSNRTTNFIDPSHLFVRITDTDMLKTNGFFVTVWNLAPGGGYSESEYFTINRAATSNNSTGNSNSNIGSNTNSNNNSSNQTNTSNNSSQSGTYDYNANSNNPDNDNNSDLAAGAIFGSNSFIPSSILEWIIFAILILIIVILARKIFGGSRRYHAAPMKDGTR